MNKLQLNPNLVPCRNNFTPSFLGFLPHKKPLLNPPRFARCRKAPTFWCRQSESYDQQQPQQRLSASDEAFSSSPVGVPSRVFVGHSIYKGKAALTVEPGAPEFAPLDSGAYKLSKEGFLLLQFAPAAGMRVYDWSKKQVFSLSVTEIGTLIGLGARDSCEFFHDPFKGRSDEGKIRKVLKVEPLPDGSGHFFNLSVQNKMLNLDESIYIPVTKAEYTVLVSAFNFILPYLIGWHSFTSTIRLEDNAHPNSNANPRYGGDYEWSRCPQQEALTVCFFLAHFVRSLFILFAILVKMRDWVVHFYSPRQLSCCCR